MSESLKLELGTGDDMAVNLLRMMTAAVDDAQESGIVRAFVEGFRSAVPNRFDQPREVFRIMRQRVVFERDPVGRELVRSPADMIEQMRATGVAKGDCDDRSTLGASLMAMLGFEVAFILAAKKPTDRWAHVLWAYLDGGGWTAMDPQEVNVPGMLPPQAERHEVFPLENLRKSV